MPRWCLKRSSQKTRRARKSWVPELTSTWRPRTGTWWPRRPSHLVKVEPEEAGWWINLAYATRRCESIKKAETILLRARELHQDNALIEFNLACYASIQSYFEEVKARLQQAIELDQETRRMALDDPDLEPLWNWIKRE
jgi:tetratricopeptide (TPR) repeat protein